MDKIIYEIDADNSITFIKPRELLRVENYLNEFLTNELSEES